MSTWRNLALYGLATVGAISIGYAGTVKAFGLDREPKPHGQVTSMIMPANTPGNIHCFYAPDLDINVSLQVEAGDTVPDFATFEPTPQFRRYFRENGPVWSPEFLIKEIPCIRRK